MRTEVNSLSNFHLAHIVKPSICPNINRRVYTGSYTICVSARPLGTYHALVVPPASFRPVQHEACLHIHIRLRFAYSRSAPWPPYINNFHSGRRQLQLQSACSRNLWIISDFDHTHSFVSKICKSSYCVWAFHPPTTKIWSFIKLYAHLSSGNLQTFYFLPRPTV